MSASSLLSFCTHALESKGDSWLVARLVTIYGLSPMVATYGREVGLCLMSSASALVTIYGELGW